MNIIKMQIIRCDSLTSQELIADDKCNQANLILFIFNNIYTNKQENYLCYKKIIYAVYFV